MQASENKKSINTSEDEKTTTFDHMPTFRVYPNPASELIKIEGLNSEKDDYIATLFDVQGKLIVKRALDPIENYLEIKSLDPGNYILRISSINESIVHREQIVIIKNRTK